MTSPMESEVFIHYSYLNLHLSFWLEDPPEDQTRIHNLARLMLTRLFERGN